MTFVIRTITFVEDGSVALEYVQPETDMKVNGLAQNHILYVPGDDDYEEEIQELISAAVHLLRDALDDLPRLASMASLTGASDTDDDEDED